MAYLGNDQAVVQVEATKSKNLTVGGRVAYALWRSVYAVKQVDVRNRVGYTSFTVGFLLLKLTHKPSATNPSYMNFVMANTDSCPV